MANEKFLVDIDLDKNQLLNAIVQNLATFPSTPSQGQIFYHTANRAIYQYDGIGPDNGWTNLANSTYIHPTQEALSPVLTGASVLATLTVNTLGHVTAATIRNLTLADLGYTGATNANNYVHPTPGAIDTGALTGVQVVSRIIVNAEGHVTTVSTRSLSAADIAAIIINDAATATGTTWSSTKIASEIATAITAGMVFKGSYAASAAPPTGAAIKIGFTYVVSAITSGAGATFWGGVTLQVGDMIIALQDNPTLAAHWTALNKNIPDIVAATESIQGIIAIATQAECTTGTDDSKAVTPLKMKAYVNGLVVSYEATVGNGALTTIPVTHNLATTKVNCHLRETTGGKIVHCETLVVDANNLSLKFNTAPTAAQYTVVVAK